MLGLTSYDSSDEDDNGEPEELVKENGTPLHNTQNTTPPSQPSQDPSTTGPLLGPAPNPSEHPSTSPSPPNTTPPPTTRQQIHALTLPPLPNLSIPPSPPGPPRPSAATKITRFLALKRQGVHFNDKLAASPALANPQLLQTLMAYAGVDEALGQYASTLPEGVAPVPGCGFPREAYVEELARAQLEVAKGRAGGGGVEFVPESMTRTGGVGSLGVGKGSAQQLMTRVDRAESSNQQVRVSGKERGNGNRKSRFDDRNGGRSQSPRGRRDGGR